MAKAKAKANRYAVVAQDGTTRFANCTIRQAAGFARASDIIIKWDERSLCAECGRTHAYIGLCAPAGQGGPRI